MKITLPRNFQNATTVEELRRQLDELMGVLERILSTQQTTYVIRQGDPIPTDLQTNDIVIQRTLTPSVDYDTIKVWNGKKLKPLKLAYLPA